MGQYHKVVNVDKKEYIHPHRLGDGLKASEQLYSVGPGGVLSAMYVLMMCPEPRGGGDLEATEGVMGRWHGDRVVVIGDYARGDDIQGLDAEEISNAVFGGEGHAKWEDVSGIVREWFTAHANVTYKPPSYAEEEPDAWEYWLERTWKFSPYAKIDKLIEEIMELKSKL